jgi:DNA-binding transcriptional MocR family regulator
MNTPQGHRRQQQQILERRRQVAALRLAGVRDQAEVAARLGVSQPTVSRDYAALDAQWQAENLALVSVEKAVQHARLEALLRGLWQQAIGSPLAEPDSPGSPGSLPSEQPAPLPSAADDGADGADAGLPAATARGRDQLAAVDRVIAILGREARLLGLDATTTQQLEHRGSAESPVKVIIGVPPDSIR